MKIILRTVAIAALLITASCGKDSADDTAQQQQQEAEQLEQTPLEANTVSDNLLISGGTKMDGIPPAPAGTLSFDASGTSKSAFLSEGFDVTMSSDSQIVGAYIQIKAEDGTSADSYHDVNIDTNSSDNKSFKKAKRRSIKSALTKKENDISLDVDFTTEIEPGTFCYEICVYDGQGNISDPQEVCITVESWGGFAAAVGNWNMTKEEKTNQDGSITIIPLGEETCTPTTITCDNDETLETQDNCIFVNKEKLTINADGTYLYEYDENYKYLDGLDTMSECEEVYKDDSYIEISKGKWSYVSEENHLVFLEFEYSDGEEEEVYESGNAESLFDDSVEIDGNELIAITGNYKAYFKK